MNQDKIDQQVTRLLKNEMNPFNFDNFMHAVCQEALDPYEAKIEEALRKGDNHALGVIIAGAIYTYWEKKAESDAQQSYVMGYL